MEKQMDNHMEEFICSIIGFVAYMKMHILGVQLVEVNVLHTGYDLGNKLVNMSIAVATACIAYLAVWLLKKFVTHEIKDK